MIVKYGIRSIIAHRVSSLSSFIVVVCSTAAVMLLFGYTEGLEANARGGADPSVAVVVAEGLDEDSEAITAPKLNAVRVLDGIARRDGVPLVSPELVTLSSLVSEDGSKLDVRILRGVDPVALSVRPSVHLRGRLPGPSEPGVVVGARLLGEHGIVEGGSLEVEGHKWPILGVLEATDSPFEAEIWCDRAFFKTYYQRQDDGVVYVRLQSPAGQTAFAAAVASTRGLVARSQAEFYRARLKELAVYFRTIYALLAVLLISMIFTTANTMHTSFLGRTREFATLMAIGYTRRRVASIVILESLLLTCVGATLGIALAASSNGTPLSIVEASMFFAIRITPRVLELGAAMAICTGLLSGMAAVVQLFRMQVLTSLRD